MRIRIQDVLETTKSLTYDEATDVLNPLLGQGAMNDYEFCGAATVRLTYYRAGQDLFFEGEVVGPVVGQCARCLETFRFALDVPFRIVFVPRAHRAGESTEEEIDLSHYDGPEIDLGPLVRERLILALPTRPLCSEGCQGLCPRCGVNRNAGSCECAPAASDGRFAVLRNLRAGA
jgi:uncharacterized protein